MGQSHSARSEGHQIFRTCPTCDSSGVGSLFCAVCQVQVVPILVVHVIGPIWAVNGQMITVMPGQDPQQAVLSVIADMAESLKPVRVVIADGRAETRVALRPDGSVVAQGGAAHLWSKAKATRLRDDRAVATKRKNTVIGTHPAAGASTWAHLLDLPEAQLVDERAGQVVLVCRSTPAGIDAAKRAVQTLGSAAVDAVLVVADAPGKPVPTAAREQRVLAGAVTVIPVPWLPRLRAVSEISPQLAGQLARPVQRVSKALLGAQSTNKEQAE